MNTEVELKDGQSFMIGGLLDNTETETFEKIPFLGDIPILGKFFQSMTRTKNNTELIVIVTPEIVAPIPAGQPLPSLKYPVAFLPPNSNIPMHQPDAKTADNTPPPTPTSDSGGDADREHETGEAADHREYVGRVRHIRHPDQSCHRRNRSGANCRRAAMSFGRLVSAGRLRPVAQKPGALAAGASRGLRPGQRSEA